MLLLPGNVSEARHKGTQIIKAKAALIRYLTAEAFTVIIVFGIQIYKTEE